MAIVLFLYKYHYLLFYLHVHWVSSLYPINGKTCLPDLFVSLFLYLCLSICLSVCLSVCLSACLSLSLSFPVSLSISLSFCLSVFLSLPVYLCLFLSLCIFVCLSLSVSLCLFPCVFAICLCLSVFLSLSFSPKSNYQILSKIINFCFQKGFWKVRAFFYLPMRNGINRKPNRNSGKKSMVNG